MTRRWFSSLVSVRRGALGIGIGIALEGLGVAAVASVHAQDAKQGAAPTPKAGASKTADTKSAETKPAGAGNSAGGSTSYDFEDDLVQGDLVRPDGENLLVRRRGARESLIKIREHFIPELLKSVENL